MSEKKPLDIIGVVKDFWRRANSPEGGQQQVRPGKIVDNNDYKRDIGPVNLANFLIATTKDKEDKNYRKLSAIKDAVKIFKDKKGSKNSSLYQPDEWQKVQMIINNFPNDYTQKNFDKLYEQLECEGDSTTNKDAA